VTGQEGAGAVRVLIAVDGTDDSVRVAERARALFGDEARYTVINVAETGPMYWGDDALAWGAMYPLAVPAYGAAMPLVVSAPANVPVNAVGGPPGVEGAVGGAPAGDAQAPLPTPADTAEHQAATVAADARLPDATVLGDVGDPAHAILEAARREGADVVVVGSHERSWFARLLSPSVRKDVIQEATVPVLVVPRPD
jgi:nucleotide-binding universal stress UspA family protein